MISLSKRKLDFFSFGSRFFPISQFSSLFHVVVLITCLALVFGSDMDTDGDGLSDELELRLGTNIRLADSDGDGISDFIETRGGLFIDSDGDGLLGLGLNEYEW